MQMFAPCGRSTPKLSTPYDPSKVPLCGTTMKYFGPGSGQIVASVAPSVPHSAGSCVPHKPISPC